MRHLAALLLAVAPVYAGDFALRWTPVEYAGLAGYRVAWTHDNEPNADRWLSGFDLAPNVVAATLNDLPARRGQTPYRFVVRAIGSGGKLGPPGTEIVGWPTDLLADGTRRYSNCPAFTGAMCNVFPKRLPCVKGACRRWPDPL